MANPFPNGPRRVRHPLAGRYGRRCKELCRGSNGNVLLGFADGYRTVAPWRATKKSVRG